MAETLFTTDELSLYTMSLIAGAVILCLALLYWFLRRRGHMAFMRGGANRQPRLAVLDAAAVDTRRRLVLVRRDDIEHLILIGGPSDLVVESGINRAAAQPERQKAAAARPAARAAKPAAPAPKQPASVDREPQREPVATPPRAETKPEPARPVQAETAAEPKRPKEPAAPPVAAAAVASAATVSNGRDRPSPEPAREVTARQPENPATQAPQAMTQSPPQSTPPPAAPVKPPVNPVENPATAKPSSEREAMKTEFEDALDAARELVLPATTPASEAPPAPEPDVNYAHAISQPPKDDRPPPPVTPPVEPAKPTVEGARPAATPQEGLSAEDLIADFDRVLEAEMNKSGDGQLPPTAGKQPDTKVDADNGASLEDEMKKLLGDLSTKQ